MSKYAPLRSYLENAGCEHISVTFAEIEQILGFQLPPSHAFRAWWSNNPNNSVMTKQWLAAGFKTEQVDIAGHKLVFRRAEAVEKNAAPPSDEMPQASSLKPRRHPLFGWLAGTATIPAGVDLTEPAEPAWGELAWGESEPTADGRAREPQ